MNIEQRLSKPVQITTVIALGEKARFAIVPTLDDMQRQPVDEDTGVARHAARLS
jgi:hypothetical protein